MSPLPKSDALCRAQYELRFSSLTSGGKDFVFPCDEHGRVEISGLSERSRNNYLFARAVVGREFAAPRLALVE